MGRKSKRTRLNVYCKTLLGVLERGVSGEVSFTYHSDWLNNQESFPISHSLPLREAPYSGESVTAYFDNLLPDNYAMRKAIATRVGASGTDSLDLLAALGKDCVGAFQFFLEGEMPKTSQTINAKQLNSKDIANMLRYLEKIPLGITKTEEFRISIAGAQEKTALLYYQGNWCLPLNATPTSHILKVPLGLFPNGIDLTTSVENEWFCMKLARHFGLPAASVELAQFEDQKCLVVERFDRTWSKHNSLIRLPQEDLCQAFGVPSTRKYEADSGPGITTIMNFLNSSDDRDGDRKMFFKTQLFFYLIGAIDGHAKNFSIFLNRAGFKLTPIYDVMTIFPALVGRQVERSDINLAMCVGKNRHYRLDKILYRHWEQTAKLSSFPLGLLHDTVEELLVKISSVNDLLKNLPDNFPKEVAEGTIACLLKQGEILKKG